MGIKQTFSNESKRLENRALMALALPLLGGQLAQAGFGLVDTIMAGQAGTIALAGVAVGTSLWIPLYLFIQGILMNTTPVTARHLAANQPQAADRTLQQALLLSLLLSAGVIYLLSCIDPLFPILKVDPQLIPTVKGYLTGISIGVPAAAMFLVLRSYTEAMNHTRPILWISLIGLLINIPFNYMLIYGSFGLPALGGAGCGWATSIAAWCMLIMMWVYLKKHAIYRSHPIKLAPLRLHLVTFARLLRLGLPSGLAMLFEVSIFAVVALLISRLGAEITAGHQVTLNITSMTFMVPLSLSLAATIRVGHARGKRDATALDLSLRQAMKINTGIGVAMALLLLLLHNWLPLVYTDDPAVQQLASQLLLLCAAYQLSDACQVMAIGCLRGFEDTTWSMVITLIVYWGLGLPIGYVLGLTDWVVPAMGPAGFWIGIIVGLTAAAVLLLWRLKLLKARTVLAFSA